MKSAGQINNRQIPSRTLDDLSMYLVVDGVRYDGLVQLLIKKGVFTYDELVASMENTHNNRIDAVLKNYTAEPA